MTEKPKHIHVRCDEETYRDLVNIAKEKGLDEISKVVRMAIKEFIKANKPKAVDPFT